MYTSHLPTTPAPGSCSASLLKGSLAFPSISTCHLLTFYGTLKKLNKHYFLKLSLFQLLRFDHFPSTVQQVINVLNYIICVNRKSTSLMGRYRNCIHKEKESGRTSLLSCSITSDVSKTYLVMKYMTI